MADIKDMTREEIEKYLASMPKDTTEPSAEQETTAENIMRGADGNYDVSKVSLNKMFADKANERGYTDSQTGEKKSYNKGSKWQAKMDTLPEDARNYIYQRINEYKSKGRPLNKWDLREIEHSAKAKFGLPKSFDISSGVMFDSTMAKILNGINMPKTETPPATETPKETETTVVQKPAVEQKGPTTNDELNAAFKRIKNKQASDADLALFSKYSEEQLKKMGFGPISITAIKGKKQGIPTRIGPAGGNGLGQNSVKPGEMEAANQRVADAKAENKKTNKTNISAVKAERNNVGMAKAMDQYYAHH